MEVLLLRATFHLLLGEYDAAIQDFESILNSEETSKDVKINALIKRATLHMQLENPDMTFKDFELAISINPKYGDIYHHRGQVLYIFFITYDIHVYKEVKLCIVKYYICIIK